MIFEGKAFLPLVSASFWQITKKKLGWIKIGFSIPGKFILIFKFISSAGASAFILDIDDKFKLSAINI